MNTTHWIHPVHARGVPSRTYSNVVQGPLTDAAIFRYALAGFYGEVAQKRAKEEEKFKAERKKAKKVHETVVRNLLKELDEE